MLKIKLLHPDILSVLASNGHGAKVLIADSNYPFITGTSPACKRVFLNLSPGLLTVTDVLKVVKDYIPIEAGIVMVPPGGDSQPIHNEFAELLGSQVKLTAEKRFDFYREVKSEETCLVIATGETRRFANILLVIGSIKP